MKRVSIIVPALNEGENLVATVKDITHCCTGLGLEYEILVFDDHSEDETGAMADALASRDRHIRVFHNTQRLNIGGIYKAGIQEARHEYYLLIPGDREVVVDEVMTGVHYLDQADLVLTYIANPEIRPLLRRFLSRTYTRVVNALFGTNFTYTNGSNIYRTDLLRRIHIHTNGFSYQTEALIKLVRQGANFIELGMYIRPRAHGRSTALLLRNWIKVIRAITTLWWDVRVVNRRRYGQLGQRLNKVPHAASSTIMAYQ